MAHLDIRNVDASKVSMQRSPVGPLPKYLRQQKVFPDYEKALIGDLVLVSPFRPSVTQNLIMTHQLERYGEEHAMWTHAAIYIGNSNICEATTAGVKVSQIENYLENYSVKFRRASFKNETDRFRVSIAAVTKLRQGYNWKSILNFASDHMAKGMPRRLALPMKQAKKAAFTCSGLFYEAFFEVTEATCTNSVSFEICPADLSASQKLNDVPIGWVSLPN